MNETWTEEELRAAVEAYVDMHVKEQNHIPYVKKHYYAELSERFGRTAKSYEYRMQNISHVYAQMGRGWVSGLKPAKNVGKRASEIIERLISEVDGNNFKKYTELADRSLTPKSSGFRERPLGIKEPRKNFTSVTTYERDPKVRAWILSESKGICECCDGQAPFVSTEGEPFLEVHHLRRLADGGSDTVSNALALCPNCHREMHYGENNRELMQKLYKKIVRLVPE